MLNTQLIVEDAQTWKLNGELSFSTVGQLLTECNKHSLPSNVDLQAVTRADSAGLAFLIELMKRANPTPIHFLNIPQQVLTIAKINDVRSLLTSTSSTLSYC